MSEQQLTASSSLDYMQLIAVLRDQAFFMCVNGETLPHGPVAKYHGTAKRKIASLFCRIERGDKIDGLKLDNGFWFVMPAVSPDDDMPDGFRSSDIECVNMVPEDSVEMVPVRTRRERTPQEEAEWLEDKRAEYEADRICGHAWGSI